MKNSARKSARALQSSQTRDSLQALESQRTPRLEIVLIAALLLAFLPALALGQVTVQPFSLTGDGKDGEAEANWTDSSCSSDCVSDESCGLGLTKVHYEFPSSGNFCSGDYSKSGDVHFKKIKAGSNDAPTSNSSGCNFDNVLADLHGNHCCVYYPLGAASYDNTSCDFDTTLEGANLTVGDGSVFLQHVEYSLSKSSNTLSGSVPVTFSQGGVYAVAPVLYGFEAKYGDDHHVEKMSFSTGQAQGFSDGTAEVELEGEIKVKDDGSNSANASDSWLRATVIGLSDAGDAFPTDAEDSSDQVRAPLLAVLEVTRDGDLDCVLMASKYNDVMDGENASGGSDCTSDTSYETTIDDDGQITLTLTDLTGSTQVASTTSTFVNGVDLHFNNNDHHVKKVSFTTGGSVTIGDRSLDPTYDTCTQTIQFTPSLDMDDRNGNHAHGDSTLDVVLLVFFENAETDCQDLS